MHLPFQECWRPAEGDEAAERLLMMTPFRPHRPDLLLLLHCPVGSNGTSSSDSLLQLMQPRFAAKRI